MKHSPLHVLGLWLLAGAAASAAAPASATTPWRNHESLKNEETFKQDWSPNPPDGYRVETGGLHLIGDSGITSRFELANQGSFRVEFTAQTRNVFVTLCGETIKLDAVPGAEKYWLEVMRQGRALRYTLTVRETVMVGPPRKKVPVKRDRLAAANAVQIKEDQVRRPSKVTFSSQRVRGGFGNENRFHDVVIQKIFVSGNVILPPPDPGRAGAEAPAASKPDTNKPHVVATWAHEVGPRRQVKQSTIKLYSNGRINAPDGPATWTLTGTRLTLRWPNPAAPGGAWEDDCTLSPDGKTYLGRNQRGVRISGVKVSEGDPDKKP